MLEITNNFFCLFNGCGNGHTFNVHLMYRILRRTNRTAV